MFGRTLDFLSKDVAMDLGTANTLIYVRGAGIVLDEPSIVTLDPNTRKVVAVGSDARNFSGRHGKAFTTIRPLKDGVIRDFDIASAMIRAFLRKAFRRIPLFHPMLVIAVPTDITAMEKRALIEAAKKAGAGKVYMIGEPIAAAMGTGLRVDQPVGHMVVDIGGGTTEVAVVCKYTTAFGESLRIAGDEFNDAICDYVRMKYRAEISEGMAETIKIKIGSVVPLKKKLAVKFCAKDISTGMPKSIQLSDSEVRDAVRKPTTAIVEAVKRVLESASPDLASDIAEKGIWLVGGGALMKGWRRLFYQTAGLDVRISQDPLRSTIRGAGVITEHFRIYRHIVHNGRLPRYPAQR